jgi:hypothetical protein
MIRGQFCFGLSGAEFADATEPVGRLHTMFLTIVWFWGFLPHQN